MKWYAMVWDWYGMVQYGIDIGMVLVLVWHWYAYHCQYIPLPCNGIGIGIVIGMQWYGIGICIGMVLYSYGVGIGILGICKREFSTMAMLCGTLSHIHVRIRDEKYSLVWSKNPILR